MSESPSTPTSANGATENDTDGGAVPNTETGAGIGASDEPNTMEPEEIPEAVDAPTE